MQVEALRWSLGRVKEKKNRGRLYGAPRDVWGGGGVRPCTGVVKVRTSELTGLTQPRAAERLYDENRLHPVYMQQRFYNG